MKSIADQLSPEIARQIHPDRRKNEAAYWAVRDQLLDQYRGQWIGFADGKVIASGTSPVSVFHAGEATGLHPFFICVGKEEEPCRIRRLGSPYDAAINRWLIACNASRASVARLMCPFGTAGSRGLMRMRVPPACTAISSQNRRIVGIAVPPPHSTTTRCLPNTD